MLMRTDPFREPDRCASRSGRRPSHPGSARVGQSGADVTAGLPADTAFVELVCADDDLLRLEFEAIIAAAFPTGPLGQE